MGEREREKKRQRERERQTDRERERETDRQRERDRERERERERERKKDREREIERLHGLRTSKAEKSKHSKWINTEKSKVVRKANGMLHHSYRHSWDPEENNRNLQCELMKQIYVSKLSAHFVCTILFAGA